jgi:hypothetical protein
MAAPRLRLRRGTSNPEDVASFLTSPALVGEPFFADTDGSVPTTEGTGTGDFYIADGGSAFVHIGGSSYTARVDSFLVDQIPTNDPGISEGGKVIFEEGGPSPETITLQAPVQDAATNSYVIKLPVGAPTTPGPYLLEYDQATSQLSFEPQVASEQLTTRQAPEDTDATADVYYPTFVANNNADPGALETFYTEGQLTFLPDKDGNAAGTISSLQITGEYVASTGYFSGTGSTDTASVTTNFATEPTASGNTKAVNVGTGAASGSTTNVNIGSVEGGTTTINSSTIVGAATIQNVFNATATTVNAFGAASTINMGASGGTMTVANDIVDLDGDLNVDGGDITTNGTGAFNLLNTNATTVNAFGAATTVQIGLAGASTTNINGTTANTLGTLNGALVVDGGASVAGNVTIGLDLSVEGGDIIADPANLSNTAQLFNTSTGTVNVANAATTVDEYSAATSLDIGYNDSDSSTTSIAVGAVATGNTKTVNIGTGAGEGTTNINIGTGGALNSITNITFGSTADEDSTTVTINGNLTVLGTQTTTNINTTNTNVQDALLALNSGISSIANNTNDVGLFIERGSSERNAFVGYDESADFFVTAYISSAKTASGFVTFDSAVVSGDTAATPLDFLPIQIGELRFSDSTSRRGDLLSAEGAQVNDVVIGHLTASEADTEFTVTDGIAGRHLYNVVIDGGSF